MKALQFWNLYNLKSFLKNIKLVLEQAVQCEAKKRWCNRFLVCFIIFHDEGLLQDVPKIQIVFSELQIQLRFFLKVCAVTVVVWQRACSAFGTKSYLIQYVVEKGRTITWSFKRLIHTQLIGISEVYVVMTAPKLKLSIYNKEYLVSCRSFTILPHTI